MLKANNSVFSPMWSYCNVNGNVSVFKNVSFHSRPVFVFVTIAHLLLFIISVAILYLLLFQFFTKEP